MREQLRSDCRLNKSREQARLIPDALQDTLLSFYRQRRDAAKGAWALNISHTHVTQYSAGGPFSGRVDGDRGPGGEGVCYVEVPPGRRLDVRRRAQGPLGEESPAGRQEQDRAQREHLSLIH